jgi:membrane associated rhomboid family serine protease
MSSDSRDIKYEAALFKRKIFLSMLIPGILVFVMWLVKAVELIFSLDLTPLGIFPLTIKGLPGIIFSPFVHAGFNHLFSNSLPLFFLGTALFYFYGEIAVKVGLWTWFITGFLVWLGGREAWHIGASGLVYGLASFLFFSGIIRRYFRLIALSLLIVFLYGSMVWGIFPDVYKNVSWESHMLGFVSGIILAIWYSKEGPQEPTPEWMEEEEEDKNPDESGATLPDDEKSNDDPVL